MGTLDWSGTCRQFLFRLGGGRLTPNGRYKNFSMLSTFGCHFLCGTRHKHNIVKSVRLDTDSASGSDSGSTTGIKCAARRSSCIYQSFLWQKRESAPSPTQPNPKSVLRCNPIIELRGHIAAKDAAAAVTLDGHVAARDAVKVTKELRQRRKGDLLPD